MRLLTDTSSSIITGDEDVASSLIEMAELAEDFCNSFATRSTLMLDPPRRNYIGPPRPEKNGKRINEQSVSLRHKKLKDKSSTATTIYS